MTTKSTIRILNPHLLQMRNAEGFLSWEYADLQTRQVFDMPAGLG